MFRRVTENKLFSKWRSEDALEIVEGRAEKPIRFPALGFPLVPVRREYSFLASFALSWGSRVVPRRERKARSTIDALSRRRSEQLAGQRPGRTAEPVGLLGSKA